MEPRVHYAYCSACDRQVPVVLREGTVLGPKPSASDAENLVCLAHGDTCTGDMCPLFDIPSRQLRENLERYTREAGEAPAPSREESRGP